MIQNIQRLPKLIYIRVPSQTGVILLDGVWLQILGSAANDIWPFPPTTTNIERGSLCMILTGNGPWFAIGSKVGQHQSGRCEYAFTHVIFLLCWYEQKIPEKSMGTRHGYLAI